jgi:predicted peptidase
MYERREVFVDGTLTRYRIYVPPAADVPLPVILFLHGAGESGHDDILPTTVGIGPAIDAAPERFPALVVFPQASRGYGWRGFNLEAALAALDDAQRELPTERERVYVTGISMGGYGTWLAALQQPERFAAAVPVCGGLDRSASHLTAPAAAERLAAIPHWVFHGDADKTIAVDESRTMVQALRFAGAEVRYTEYPGVGHNSWDRAYAESELMPWLLRQRLR